MIRFICKNLQERRCKASIFIDAYFFSTSTAKHVLGTSNSNSPQSLALSYLLNSCGLPLELATCASKKLQLYNTDRPDSVLNLLKTHGLSQTHIQNLIANRPNLLLADPDITLKPNFELLGTLGFSSNSLVKVLEKDARILETDVHTTIEFFRSHGFSDEQICVITMKRPALYVYNAHKCFKPKLEFFKTLGLSGEEIAQILSSEPYILERSLENQILPSVKAIKRVLGTDDSVLRAIKACYRILEFNLGEVLEPNIAVLTSHGVPESNVLKLIKIQPRTFLLRTCRFTEVVGEVKKFGFDPTKLLFLLAIRAMVVTSKSLWERKMECFCSFGMSEDDVISAFKLQPMCMLTSEKKIKNLMGFYVNELKFKPSMISKNPNLLLLSLERRIIPRCSVLHLLMSNNHIKGNISLVNALRMTEKMFLAKYVSKFRHVMPKVIEAYEGKIKIKAYSLSTSLQMAVTSWK